MFNWKFSSRKCNLKKGLESSEDCLWNENILLFLSSIRLPLPLSPFNTQYFKNGNQSWFRKEVIWGRTTLGPKKGILMKNHVISIMHQGWIRKFTKMLTYFLIKSGKFCLLSGKHFEKLHVKSKKFHWWSQNFQILSPSPHRPIIKPTQVLP